jgi:hypothetical protein
VEEYREEIDSSAVRIRENREFSAKIQPSRKEPLEYGSLESNAPTRLLKTPGKVSSSYSLPNTHPKYSINHRCFQKLATILTNLLQLVLINIWK